MLSSFKSNLFCYLTVATSYYWGFKTVKSGFVEGSPTFKANGDVSAGDGGLIFNGVTSWLAARVDKTDCLVDPERCVKGFSIGAMLKLSPDIKEYGEARYIIDTGAHSEDTRGVSLYTVSGKLHFMFATSTKTWEVSCFSLVLHSSKYNTIQYNTLHYNALQYNTVQYNTIQSKSCFNL